MIMPSCGELDGLSCTSNKAESVANVRRMALDETDMFHERLLVPNSRRSRFGNQACELHV